MFLIIDACLGLPLLLCSVMAGCSGGAFASRMWLVGAMALPTVFSAVMFLACLIEGAWKGALSALLVWAMLGGICWGICLAARHIKRALTEPYE